MATRATTTQATRTLLDSEHGQHGQDDILEQVWRIGTDTVRVQVHRNTYSSQSWAKASVLTDGRTWTDLAVALSSNWHSRQADLQVVAAGLTDRAARILSTTGR
jgi:hypothetical protein